jgi:hypothetical protein
MNLRSQAWIERHGATGLKRCSTQNSRMSLMASTSKSFGSDFVDFWRH